MALELDYNRSLYGVEHRAGPFPVTRELVQAFSLGIGETSPSSPTWKLPGPLVTPTCLRRPPSAPYSSARSSCPVSTWSLAKSPCTPGSGCKASPPLSPETTSALPLTSRMSTRRPAAPAPWSSLCGRPHSAISTGPWWPRSKSHSPAGNRSDVHPGQARPALVLKQSLTV